MSNSHVFSSLIGPVDDDLSQSDETSAALRAAGFKSVSLIYSSMMLFMADYCHVSQNKYKQRDVVELTIIHSKISYLCFQLDLHH